MPRLAALKACVFLARGTGRLTLAHAAGAANKSIAVRRRAPFQAAVFTDQDVLIDSLEHL